MLTYFSYLSAVNQISSSNTALLLLEVVTVYLWIQASLVSSVSSVIPDSLRIEIRALWGPTICCRTPYSCHCRYFMTLAVCLSLFLSMVLCNG